MKTMNQDTSKATARPWRVGTTLSKLLNNNSTPLVERIMCQVWQESNSGCWLWTGAANSYPNGWRGVINLHGRQWLAHRLTYEVFVGKIPSEMLACHKCDNTLCVNPNHLFLGTVKDNTHDMLQKRRGFFQVCPEEHARKVASGNRIRPYKNPTGFRGVSLTKNGRYEAGCTVNRRSIYIGTFDTPEKAHEAYMNYQQSLRKAGQ